MNRKEVGAAETRLTTLGLKPNRMFDGPGGYKLFVTVAGKMHELRSIRDVQQIQRAAQRRLL